jgi:uncharacterized protein YkwD
MATRRLLPLPLFAVMLGLLLAVPPAPAAAAPCAGADLMPTAQNTAQIRSATRCLINRERRRRGRRALSADGQLTSAAQAYSQHMVDEGFFAHVSPTGSTLLSRIRQTTRYLAKTVSYALGENLAWGSGERATPRETVIAWMASPGHRRNILDRTFRQVGIGIAMGAPTDTQGLPAATYTTEFGRRSSR